MKENNKLSLSDLNDSAILRENESLLSLLLKDHTTGKNIKWGTDSYIIHGYSFRDDQEIKIDLITGWYEGFIRPRVDKDIDTQLERQRNRAEVFTPSWVIKLQVDAVLEDMEELSLVDFIQTKWLEITCGEAPYMVNRYDMETGEVISLKDRAGFVDVKFKKLNEAIETEEEWLKLAVEIYKASYGYEYQGDSLLLARENLILTFIDNYFYMFGAFPKEKILLEITKIISLNVFQMDGLTYEVPYSVGGLEESGTQLSLFEEIETEENITPKLTNIKLWGVDKTIEFKLLSERNDTEMKFDVVIGNPPYQIEGTGSNTRGEPIYHIFLEESYKIADKSLLITPGRFLFNVGQTPSSWNNKMLNDSHLKVIYYESNSSKVFPNTEIKGGVTITYRDSNKNYEPIKMFIPYIELETSLNKVLSSPDFKSLSSVVYSSMSYKYSRKLYDEIPYAGKILSGNTVRTNAFEKLPEVFHNNKPNNGNEYIKIFGRQKNKRVYKWIRRDYISEHPNLDKYKVFVAKSNGSGDFGETLSEMVVGDSYCGHTQSFVSVGAFDNENEARNAKKYIKTKLARALLGVKKVTQDNQKSTWEFVPIQDFTRSSNIDWDTTISEIDQQLYKKYELSQEEINFIENNVKEME
ncbi:Eco57I restriction-modification methylase domain-containing protein [Aerococcaceae bacterium INB8]|uniref:Eco57I restriction-modification methylase domain-containing protein n=1 Tax=Ruoffia halotolerans TaxID=2748684 RepID=A0A839A8H1_9LACT|nr:Eco57I restriction-modification methylase domain-containing protein [Ruoffia halotolerans]MBA5730181.1 Eco57I restriction-modification methylase domain-containing protein [Ruoffia halotolerans]